MNHCFLIDRVELAAQRFPDRIAFSSETASVTYAELLQGTLAVGTYMGRLLPRLTPVCILMQREVWAVEAIFGVMQSNLIAAPLDPTMPVERLLKVFETLRPGCLLVDDSAAELVAALKGRYDCPVRHIRDALACDPDLLICDEPTTALDVTVQAQIMDLLKEIQKDTGTSFIFISHDFGLVYESADKVAVMYNGHIVEKSEAKELFSNPKHPYTTALLKTLPDFNSKKLDTIEGQPPSVTDVFKGCSFEPRCTKKTDVCKTVKPDCYNAGNSCVSCLLYKQLTKN